MAESDDAADPTRPAAPSPRLQLRPFPAMRFNPDLVGDIGSVTCPPYDVMERAMIEDLLAAHPRNVVRLVLPRLVHEPLGTDEPYIIAAKRLARWRRQTTLITDREPGLYVYEYGTPDVTICGLVGTLDLRKRDRAAILPHEGVIPAIVAERLAMVVAARANLEPILLIYDGDQTASDQVEAARRREPLTDVMAADGTRHRLWSITSTSAIEDIRRALRPHQALIADGHHRYAMYQQLRRRHRAIGDGAGPWDRGLAMLVDQSRYPLRVGAIHRSVAEPALSSALVPAECTLLESRPLHGQLPQPPSESGLVVVTDGILEHTIRLPSSALPGSEVEYLHRHLLPAWSVTEDRVGYHHTVAQTMHSAHQEDGLGVLLHPASVEQVMALARADRMMPRKSTSFGPKPRMGIVMRAFEDEM